MSLIELAERCEAAAQIERIIADAHPDYTRVSMIATARAMTLSKEAAALRARAQQEN